MAEKLRRVIAVTGYWISCHLLLDSLPFLIGYFAIYPIYLKNRPRLVIIPKQAVPLCQPQPVSNKVITSFEKTIEACLLPSPSHHRGGWHQKPDNPI